MASAELMGGLDTDRAARCALGYSALGYSVPGDSVPENGALASRPLIRIFASSAVPRAGLCNLDAHDCASSLAVFVDVTRSCAARNDPASGPFGQVAASPQHRATVQLTACGQDSVGGRCAE
jgi:hypothetical protein